MKIEKTMPWLCEYGSDEELRQATPEEVVLAAHTDNVLDIDGRDAYVSLSDDELYPLAQEIEDELARRASRKRR